MTICIYVKTTEIVTETVTHVCESLGCTVDQCTIVHESDCTIDQLIHNCTSGDTVVCVSTNTEIRTECVSHNITYIDASLHAVNNSECHDHLINPNAEEFKDGLSKLVLYYVSSDCDERNHMKLERFSHSLDLRHAVKTVSVEEKDDYDSKCWVARKLGFVIESCNSDDTLVFLTYTDISSNISEQLEVINRCIKRNISVYFYHTMSVANPDAIKNASEYELYTRLNVLETQTKLHMYHKTFNEIRQNQIIPMFTKTTFDSKIDQIIHSIVDEGMTIKGTAAIIGVDYESLCDFIVQRLSTIPIRHQTNPFINI